MKRTLRKMGTRVLAGLLVICMMLPMLPAPVFAENPVRPDVHYGDVNKDGKIDEADVTMLKQYLAEYKNLDIDEAAADVNGDTKKDLKDLLLLEQYVAGLDVVLGASVRVSFDARGGAAVEPVYVCKGATLASVLDKMPTTEKAGAIFAGWYVNENTPFYAEDVLNQNVTVFAKYEELASSEELTLTSYALEKQNKDLSFSIVTDTAMTEDAVKAALSLLIMDGTDPVELEVVRVSDTEFTVKAANGFTEGASYQLVLSDGLHFKGKEESIKTANFTIDKEEVSKINYNDDIIYIKDTDEMTYQINDKDGKKTVEMLEIAVLTNREDKEPVTGSFTYTERPLEVGNILCIYKNTPPNERAVNDGKDYTDDPASYVEVVEVDGSTIDFRAINEKNADKLFKLPDTIPFSVLTPEEILEWEESQEGTDTTPGTDVEGSETPDTTPGTETEGSETTKPTPGTDVEDSETTKPTPGTDAEGSGTTGTTPGSGTEGSEATDTTTGTDTESSEATDATTETGTEGTEGTEATDTTTPGETTASVHRNRVARVSTEAPQGTETKIPEGTETKIPEGTETKIPEGTETKIPEGTETKIPEGTETKTPEGTETKIPEETETKIPEGTETKIPEGTEIKTETDTETTDTTETDTETETDAVKRPLALPTEKTGTVDAADYDTEAWGIMGRIEDPEIDPGDFVVFYEGAFKDIKEDTPVYYGLVTKVEEGVIYYEETTAEAVAASQELYGEQTLKGDQILENVDTEALEREAEKQAIESGFAENAANYLAEMAQQTDGFQNMQIQNLRARTADGRELSRSDLARIGGSWEIGDNVTVHAQLGKSSKYFTDGISLALNIKAEFSVDAGEDGEIKIELSATFIEEISIHIDTFGNAKVKWYVIVPVLKSLRFGASIDVKNYSAISVDVKIYSVQKEEEGLWGKLKELTKDTQIGPLLEKADELKEKIAKAKETAEQIQGYKEDLEAVWAEISDLSAKKGEKLTREDYEGMLETLGELNVTEELAELLHIADDEEMEAGVRNLMQRYSEMMQTESEWFTLLEKEIFTKEQMVTPATPVLAVAIKMDFVIKANINIALGANMEYVVGKRYSFWIDVVEKTSGSTTMDLLDEQFAFQFYVMGALGLKMGVRAELAVGLFSTSLASIGVQTEFGPYVKLWGYFIYEYAKQRPANSTEWTYDEKMMGALYLEFGIYLEVAFNAQALWGLFQYNPTLYDQEFPLLTVGDRKNHYEFGYEIEDDEVVLVNDDDKNSNNGIAMKLPENYRLMNYLDLVEGNLEAEVCGYDNFLITLSNRNFTFDPNTGNITVDVPDGVQYMECDMTLTWKKGKLEFGSRDITITLPLVWTSLATDELNQRFTATVKVGNQEDGFITVWSEREKKNTAFDLPTEDEILDLIGYDRYDNFGTNLKYANIGGYKNQTTEGLKIYQDATYYFDADLNEYAITVKDVENADGTKAERSYKALYGSTFALKDLLESGTSNTALNPSYTAYLKTEAMQDKVIDSDITRPIDNSFARELLSGTTYTAKYVDNSAKATFTFVGYNIGLEPQSVIVKKGTIPPITFSNELLMKDASIESFAPVLGNISTDTEFITTLIYDPSPRYPLTFHTNGGTELAAWSMPEGALLFTPGATERTGYVFGGWYRDAALTEAFDFTNAKMPGQVLDLYAKWIAKSFAVTLDANEGNLPEGQANPITFIYDGTYAALPTPVRAGFKFLGWFTDRLGGEKVNKADTVKLLENTTLYAHWEEKLTISPDAITYAEGQGLVYDRQTHYFEFDTAGYDKSQFEVYYKRQVLDNTYATEAKNAGTYDIKLVRQEDDTYKYFETVLTGVYIIEKADSSISNVPAVKEVYYGEVLPSQMVRDVECTGDGDYIGDGAFEYAISESAWMITKDKQTGEVTAEEVMREPAESDWVSTKALYNLYDKKADWTPTAYYYTEMISGIFPVQDPSTRHDGRLYLWARLKEGENYKASEAKAGNEPFELDTEKPKSLLFPEVFKYYVTIKTGDKKSGAIQQAGTDSTINFCIEDTQTRKDGNGKPFNAKQIDTFQLTVDAAKPYNRSYGAIPVSLSITQHGAGPDWFCDEFWFYRGKENPSVDGAGNIVNGVGEHHTVDHWFKDNNTYEYADINGFIREITEWSGFNAADNTTSVDVTANAGNFVWDWTEPAITDGNAELTYNPYEHLNAPELSVTFGNEKLDRYITQGIHDFTVDNKGLYQAMVENQLHSLNLTYTLEFKPVNGNASVTADTAKRQKTITFTCADVSENAKPAMVMSARPMTAAFAETAKKLAAGATAALMPVTAGNAAETAPVSSDVNYQLANFARGMRSIAGGELASVAGTIIPGENGTFDVTYRMNENAGIWATKFAVEFDETKVEMQNYKVGNIFTEAEVTAPDKKTTAEGRYVFLATKGRGADNQTFTDTTETGTLVTLTFKIKDKTLTDYPVTLAMTQSLSAETGELSTPDLNSNDARIRVSGNTEAVRKFDTVRIAVSGGDKKIAKVQVQKDAGEVKDITNAYESGYTVTENGTYTFTVILEDGERASTSITYANLDSRKPELKITADDYAENTWSAGKLTLKVEDTVGTLGTMTVRYRIGGGSWNAYKEPMVIGEDGKVTEAVYEFVAVSASGVESDPVTYRVKLDNANPVASIEMGENRWNTFLNNITFGKLFKNTQKVSIKASDEGSGVDKVLYYLSDKGLTEAELIGLTAEQWSKGDSFNIDKESKYVIYAKVTDKAGNNTIVNSEGFVLDYQTLFINGVTTEDNSQKTTAVGTGDENQIVLWILLAAVGVVILAGVSVRRRKVRR